MTNILIFGASRGLGAAFNRSVPREGDTAWLLSRAQPDLSGADVKRVWVQADLSKPDAGDALMKAIGDARLDVVIYNSGIWAATEFSSRYDVTNISDEETSRIITVNLTSAITCLRRLLPNLKKSDNAKVILIGSINGLENARQEQVAYSASKFGLRGVAHALREHWRKYRIAVTVINPGSIEGDGIPHDDLCEIVNCLVRLSNQSCVKEIDMPAMSDEL
jgi:NAD(P)-dependent dehydrogenase (short-subunit alcohol dehydrogenase family)